LQIGPKTLQKILQNPQKIPKLSRALVRLRQSYPVAQNSRITLEPLEMTILPFKASKAHMFLSRALFSVIVAPKFGELNILSIHAFKHNNGLMHCIYLVYFVLALGNSVVEPLFEDFQEQVFEEPEVFFNKQQGKCP
jgi:hypothetical protein